MDVVRVHFSFKLLQLWTVFILSFPKNSAEIVAPRRPRYDAFPLRIAC